MIDSSIKQFKDRIVSINEDASVSPRELELAAGISCGLATKQISDVLGISTRTAETHRTHLMRKINARSAADVVRWSIKRKLVEV